MPGRLTARNTTCLGLAFAAIWGIGATSITSAQNPASNKAFFAASTDQITLGAISGNGFGPVVTLFNVPAALKTSNGGAVSATLSMEAALWTYNLTNAIVNGGKASSSSRAAIKAWIEVDGEEMQPGMVVYADRLQATGLTVNLACQTSEFPGETCVVTGNILLELFQRTKGAQAFTFFKGPLGATLHHVSAKAQGLIECRSNAAVIPCPAGTLDGYTDAQTMAAIGKATLVVEEQQNWGSK
ncbi:MAG TPA: hypothetical protein VFV95_01090 [Vicinamibacterales bacterium]|nr:hypothetical protein [Vicinamibacterales bacterium]